MNSKQRIMGCRNRSGAAEHPPFGEVSPFRAGKLCPPFSERITASHFLEGTASAVPLIISQLISYCCALGLIAFMTITANATDWPCYRGANRNGNSTESIVDWPPTLAWRVSGLGRGFACPVVSAGHVYTVGWDESNARDIVRCYDETASSTNPAPLWTGYYPAGGGRC
jgi:hypothetical protein